MSGTKAHIHVQPIKKNIYIYIYLNINYYIKFDIVIVESYMYLNKYIWHNLYRSQQYICLNHGNIT